MIENKEGKKSHTFLIFRLFFCLAFDARLGYVASANGAHVHPDVVAPQGNGVPLFHREKFLLVGGVIFHVHRHQLCHDLICDRDVQIHQMHKKINLKKKVWLVVCLLSFSPKNFFEKILKWLPTKNRFPGRGTSSSRAPCRTSTTSLTWATSSDACSLPTFTQGLNALFVFFLSFLFRFLLCFLLSFVRFFRPCFVD